MVVGGSIALGGALTPSLDSSLQQHSLGLMLAYSCHMPGSLWLGLGDIPWKLPLSGLH